MQRVVLDQIIASLWAALGGAPWTVSEALGTMDGPLRAELLDSSPDTVTTAYGSAAVRLGRALSGAELSGLCTPDGLGVARHGNKWRLVRKRAAVHLPANGREGLLDALARVEAVLGQAQAQIAAIRQAMAVQAPSQLDATDQLLSDLAVSTGGQWWTLRQLRKLFRGMPLDSERVFLAAVGREAGDWYVEQGRHSAKGWHVYRVCHGG